jgi:hypothetical protein
MAAPRPLTRAHARNCLLANQFATPGMGSLMARRCMGSLMARRWVAGLGQLLVFLTGFAIFIVGFVQRFVEMYRSIRDQSDSMGTSGIRPMLLGLAIAGLAWSWAWFTSLSLVREAKANEDAGPGAG